MIKNSQQQNPLTQDLVETEDDKGGLSPVHYSVKSGDINLTRMLLSSTREDAVDTKVRALFLSTYIHTYIHTYTYMQTYPNIQTYINSLSRS